MLLVLLGAALIAASGPLIALPVASLARRRLHLAGIGSPALGRPGTGRRGGVVAAGPLHRPAARRQTGYVCLLATVVPVLAVAHCLRRRWPWRSSPARSWSWRSSRAAARSRCSATWPPCRRRCCTWLLVALLPAVGYLVTLVAGADAATARALLLGGPDEQLRAELTEVTRSRARLADAFEAERRRIERDLHDGAQQKLLSLTLQLGMAAVDLPPGSPAAGAVAAAHQQAKQLMAELRELIHGIQPQVLPDLGLPAALAELADFCPVPATVDVPLAGRLPSQVENTAYFVAAEALTNIAKHSGATRATVTAAGTTTCWSPRSATTAVAALTQPAAPA